MLNFNDTKITFDLTENVEAAKKAGFSEENIENVIGLNLNDSVKYLLLLIEEGRFSCMAEEFENALIDEEEVYYFEDSDEEFNEEEDFSPEPLNYYDLLTFMCERHDFNHKW